MLLSEGSRCDAIAPIDAATQPAREPCGGMQRQRPHGLQVRLLGRKTPAVLRARRQALRAVRADVAVRWCHYS